MCIHKNKMKGGIVVGDDFPLVCEVCLGKNPYVRMVKLPYGQKLCQIGKVPFQGFRWKAGPNGRFKETVISSVIAKERNICQACLNDLQFGLPVGVRDNLLNDPLNQRKYSIPQSDVGAMVQYQQLQQLQSKTEGDGMASTSEYINHSNASQGNQLINFSRSMNGRDSRDNSSTAFRNLPKLCSFWLQGTCTRVKRGVCPFRPCCGIFLFPEIASSHQEEMNSLISDLEKRGADVVQKNISPELREIFQNKFKGRNAEEGIKKRVSGEDSLTEMYLSRMKSMRTELSPPSDHSITTLWVGGVESDISTEDLTDIFYSFGQIQSIRIVPTSRCAFVQYTDRPAAEYAARQLYGTLSVKGRALTLNWAQSERTIDSETASSSTSASKRGSMKALPKDDLDIPLPPGVNRISDLPTHLLPGGQGS